MTFLHQAVTYIRFFEETLGPSDDWVEDDRRILYEAIDPLLPWRAIREKGTADYITSTQVGSDRIERALYAQGYRRNLLSSRKYRTHHGGGKQWAVGSWVFDPEGTAWQHHVYLFDRRSGGTDIYGHREPSVRNPSQHLDLSTGTPGDPNNRLRDALSAEGIAFGERQITDN